MRNQYVIIEIQENVEKVHNRFKTSTHSQQEEEIERDEEEREGSPVPIFPPLSFKIVRIITR